MLNAIENSSVRQAKASVFCDIFCYAKRLQNDAHFQFRSHTKVNAFELT